MRKHDEIALYAYMRNDEMGRDYASMETAAHALGINLKRAQSLVNKWHANEWCNSIGTRFYHGAPQALLKWGEVQ